MKFFRHGWSNPEDFLLHIQLDNPEPEKPFAASVVHKLTDGRRLVEEWAVVKGETSFRFMVSRCHPLEAELSIEYPDRVTLEAYKLDDRAFYPKDAFFIG